MTDHVIDASALVDALIDEAGAGAPARFLSGRPDLHMPEVAAVEVVSALRAHERAGRRSDLAAALDAFLALPAIRWRTTDDVVRRCWELRENISAYDATYVALAERLGATLVTTDDRLARAVRVHTTVRVADLGVT